MDKRDFIDLKCQMSASLLQDVAMQTVSVVCAMNEELDRVAEIRNLVNDRVGEFMTEELVKRLVEAHGTDEIQRLVKESAMFAQRVAIEALGTDPHQLALLQSTCQGEA